MAFKSFPESWFMCFKHVNPPKQGLRAMHLTDYHQVL